MSTEVRDNEEVRSPWLLIGVAGLAVLLLVGIVVSLGGGGDDQPAHLPSSIPTSMTNTPFLAPSIDRPPTVTAANARVPDEAEVIGVSVGGKNRAYLVRAFDQPFWHVVNDVVGDVPITVTYCDRRDHVRLFTSPQRGVPLNLMLAGWVDSKMMLRIGSISFIQDAAPPAGGQGSPPLSSGVPYERTSWKAWRTAHPDTDVYVGVSEAEVLSGAAKSKGRP